MSRTAAITDRCPVCGGDRLQVTGTVPDYVSGRPDRTVLECADCAASFADDREVDPRLYDAIYRHASVLPGYRRYVQFARLVDRSSTALEQLAALDPVYEAILRLLDGPSERPRKVLELGCGLGYTTAAVRKRGIDAVGADIAEHAVSAARARYGDHYHVIDSNDPPAEWLGRFELVIATEVVEHLPDPAEFLKYAIGFLAPGGQLLITTPNKDAWGPSTTWGTDAPPVHLHWLGRRALAMLGERAGCSVSFVELRPRAVRASTALGLDHTAHAILSSDLRPLHSVPWTAKVGAKLRDHPQLYQAAAGVVAKLRRSRAVVPSSPTEADTLAAVLRPLPDR